MDSRSVCTPVTASYHQQGCTLITPGILHADTDETIILDGHNSGFEADIMVQDFPAKRQLLAQTKILVNSNNDFLGTTSINIKSRDLLSVPKRRYYVSVLVRSSQCVLEKVVLVTFHSGYIFIQTDKTIYTPGSKVLHRIYPLNYKMQSKKQTVIIEVKNPDGIVTQNNQWFPDNYGLISKSYELSELAKHGTWTITARYDNTQEEFSAHFEVKEYVLPIFEVTIMPEKSFMYLDDEQFSVTIKSQYIYKKPVVGKGFVVFGLKKDGEKKIVTDSLRRIEISEGIGHVKLQRKDLIKSFKNPEDLLQYKLYVVVTVITDVGSDFVEAESDDIYIVKSPYKIAFFKTSKYFKPGMPFDVTVMVTNPDGSPAKSILVKDTPGVNQGRTDEDGIARLKLNTALNVKSLTINVKTAVPNLPDHLQGSAQTKVEAYKSISGQDNYLHIGMANNVLKPKKLIYIDFNILTGKAEVQKQIKHFSYLVLSRGRIMKAGKYVRKEGQPLVSMPLFISEDLMPSFRIVAYYTINKEGINEIVSDSIWVDIVDSCMGTLSLEAERNIAKPQTPIKLTLKANHKSSVGLVVVDKGVFAINSKHKLTQRKVWDTVEKSNLGCSPGSGANNMGVFYDAGLAVQTNFKMTTTERTDASCTDTRTRKKRSSALLMEQKTQKASTYTDLEKQCCSDGMASNPMGHSCDRRARHIQDGDKCVKAFLDCCRYIELKLKTERFQKENDDLDRSEDDYEYYPDADIMVRSDFPESWLWSIVKMEEPPDAENISTKVLTNVILKDSITTWELLAVSLSEDKGICVAKPYEIQAFQSFFVDLRLPYSAVRNEQVEIRAILYNYESKDLQVRVTFAHNPEFCSLSTAKKPYAIVVKVKKNSSFPVPFVIVPLTLGQHYVEVKASVYGEFGGDGIRKMLKVVPEGVRMTTVITSKILEPQARNGEDVVNVPSLTNKNIVPDSTTRIITNIQGIPIAQFLEDAIDGASLSHLIIVPSGCAEQNMQRMTPVVIATHYLDKTNQWDRIGLNRRDEAVQNIQKGYSNQLVHRAKDGSYGSFTRTASGTWLTAYVVKVFAMAKSLIDMNDDILCGSVKWLILQRQKPDGMFQENIPLYAQYVKGGLGGSTDPDVAMTAFVIISLLESQQYCSKYLNNLQFSINRAVNFIADRYQHLKIPYSVAITSYALTLAGRLNDPSKLLSVAKDKSYWDSDGSNIVSIEATSYALLTLLKMDAKDAIDPVVRWLTEQRFYGETYVSTQATIMLFQALAQYQLAKADQEELNMDVTFQLPGRRENTKYRINVDNVNRARSEETNINKDFVVKARGRGKATLTVMAVYYEAKIEAEKKCEDFDLSVTVANEPLGRHDALETISMNICFRYRNNVDATMTIIDVSMMTGFSPDENYMKNLMNRVDKYISYFEINKGAFDKGSLIIYLDRVSHTEEECLKFNLNKYLNVGFVQPGSVTIYEYYAPEHRCHKFYHREDDKKFIGRICHENVCRCAEGNCLMNQDTEVDTAVERMKKACDAGMDYAYKVSLLDLHYEKDFDRYDMKITGVYKRGVDEVAVGNSRTFISNIRCREKLKLKKGEDYIIFGTFKSVWNPKASDYTYVLGSDTWIEWWPNDRQCQDPEHEDLCNDIALLSDELEVVGCQS
ncbi:complement C3-like isoform X2 [Hyla sarda]|uniref:complement C3-like isoform X2 n=1 Tax=Hyla sarda TaxID=327740 RepID=UPI0024C2BB2B|nr:complement C3-like isoform X2 [Hyla sarda]